MFFTLSGIDNKIVIHENNALVVKHENTVDIQKAIARLLTDNQLRENLIKNGKESVKDFTTIKKMKALEELYLIFN